MKYFAFDLETTGLDVTKDEPVEIAWAIVEPEGEYRISSMLIKTSVPICSEAQNVHKISPKICAHGYHAKWLAHFIRLFLKTTDVDGIIAYNGFRFDIPMLDNLLDRHDLEKVLCEYPVEDPALWWLADNVYNLDRPKTHDEYQRIAKMKVPYGTRYNLTAICKNLEIPFDDAHRASADLDATIKIWRKMKTMEVSK